MRRTMDTQPPHGARLHPAAHCVVIAVLAALAVGVPGASDAVEGSPEWCEQQWRSVSAATALADPSAREALLGRWEAYQKRCAGTVVYEARLALALAMNGQFDRAQAVLPPRGAEKGQRTLVDFARLQIDYFRVFIPGKATLDGVRGLETKFQKFLAQHPEHAEASLVLGGMQTLMGNHAEAVASLSRGLRTEMDVSGGLRNLTISLAGLGRWAEARQAADKALQANPRFADDPWFVYAWAKALAALGELKAAQTELLRIGKQGDEVMKDPEFREAVNFVMARLTELKARRDSGGRP